MDQPFAAFAAETGNYMSKQISRRKLVVAAGGLGISASTLGVSVRPKVYADPVPFAAVWPEQVWVGGEDDPEKPPCGYPRAARLLFELVRRWNEGVGIPNNPNRAQVKLWIKWTISHWNFDVPHDFEQVPAFPGAQVPAGAIFREMWQTEPNPNSKKQVRWIGFRPRAMIAAFYGSVASAQEPGFGWLRECVDDAQPIQPEGATEPKFFEPLQQTKSVGAQEQEEVEELVDELP